jgi:hypothetical protein
MVHRNQMHDPDLPCLFGSSPRRIVDHDPIVAPALLASMPLRLVMLALGCEILPTCKCRLPVRPAVGRVPGPCRGADMTVGPSRKHPRVRRRSPTAGSLSCPQSRTTAPWTCPTWTSRSWPRWRRSRRWSGTSWCGCSICPRLSVLPRSGRCTGLSNVVPRRPPDRHGGGRASAADRPVGRADPPAPVILRRSPMIIPWGPTALISSAFARVRQALDTGLREAMP